MRYKTQFLFFWCTQFFHRHRKYRGQHNQCNKRPWPNDHNMPTQYIATLLGVTCCVHLATILRHVGCCWRKLGYFQTWANNTQYVTTHRNTVAKRMQHAAPNKATCCLGMLQSFGQGLSAAHNGKAECNIVKCRSFPVFILTVFSMSWYKTWCYRNR